MSQHFQPNKYVPPRADQLPEACRTAAESVVKARDNWRTASDSLANTEAALRGAGGRFAQELRDAGAAGRDVAEIEDETPQLQALAERQRVALAAAYQSVLQAWHELSNVVASNWDEAVTLADGPCSDADVLVRAAEERLAEARAQQAEAVGLRSWLTSRRWPQSHDATRANANGPRPAPGLTLEQVRQSEERQEVKRKIERGEPLGDAPVEDEAAPHVRSARSPRGFW